MTTVRLNIASRDWLGDETLEGLAHRANPVPVFSAIEGRTIGRVVRYEWIAPDLLAECEIDDCAKLDGVRAAAVVAYSSNATLDPPPPVILAVLVSRLSREALSHIGLAIGARHHE